MSTRSRDDLETRRRRYYERIAERQLAPLWVFFHDWFSRRPRVRSKPHLWSYSALRELVLEAAEIIDPAEAERRVLVLENPGLQGRRLATESLYAGLQLIMPGEVAPCHRHTPAALRFVIEGQGAYTAVNGEKAYMAPGDFIVTPSWTWHEHAHEGVGPTVWLDVLDVAVIHLFNATFTEHWPGGEHPEGPPPLDSLYRYGMNMRPTGYRRGAEASPVFSYPYARVREALDALARGGAPDACHGFKLEYIDPTSGGPAVPTLSTFMQLLPRHFESEPYKSTAGTIFCVVEGSGTIEVDDGDGRTTVLEYAPRDVFVVPSWHACKLRAAAESTMFSASDQAIQAKLGFWREQRGG